MRARERNGLLSVSRLGDDVQPGAAKQLDQVEPNDCLVLGYKDSDRSSVRTPASAPFFVHHVKTWTARRPACTDGSAPASARVSSSDVT